MFNGPTYENMVKYFWMRDVVYDMDAAKREEREKIAGDPSLKGKSRAEMGLQEFTQVKICSNVIGIPITIVEEIIGMESEQEDKSLDRDYK